MATDDEIFKGVIGRTFRESEPWWPAPIEAPQGAPDVVFIVLDDVGFGDLGCYGSEIATPYIDRLAAGGLRYSNFHVTAMCSPTRACLLTGRNAHAVGMGIIAEWSSGYPGYQGRVSRRAATIPEVLRDHAYGTYAVGKWHLTNIADYGAAGPHDHWPLGRGFGRWYGFHGALTDQWNPELYQDNHAIERAPRADYHLSTDLVDHAIGNIRDHVTAAPDRPFFLYLAFGACHWPHHVPQDYMARYRGRYDVGWDAVRAERLARQKSLGIVPADAQLAPRNPDVGRWDDIPERERPYLVRLQEAYAGFLEHTDAAIGRLVDYLDSLGKRDNTLVILLSDNGASPEGGPTGAINQRKHMLYEPETPEVGIAHLDRIGSAQAFNHYPTGWAQVSNTPLKWYKKHTHGGGIRAPLILHWPKRLAPGGTVRSQYHHVTDIAPTLYETLGIEAPTQYRGVAQIPLHGTSMAYSFAAPDAPTRKETQHFELLGDRAIWHRGWKAVAHHAKGADFEADRWELYHLDRDFAEIDDLAEREPERLRRLVDLWWVEAGKYSVLPLDDRDWERAAARLRLNRTTRYEYLAGMARVDRLSAPDISDRGYRISAEFSAGETGTEGVILAWGSRFAGFVLYVKDDALCYEYVYSEAVRHAIRAPFRATPAGRMRIDLLFERTGRNAGRAILIFDGGTLGSVDVPATWPTPGTTAGLNCGFDPAAPVADAYEPPFPFTGGSLRVIVELGEGGPSDPGQLARAVLQEQ